MNVLVYCPTYRRDDGSLAIHERSLASIQSLNFSGRFTVEISADNPLRSPDYENVLHQYRRSRQMALVGEYDALMTVEHDIILSANALQLLWNTGAPVSYGVYLFRGHRNVVNVFRLVNPKRPRMAAYSSKVERGFREKVISVNGCGNGCLLIRREVLEQVPFRRNDNGSPAVDIPFAQDCERLGIRQVGHFGVLCGHIINGRALYLSRDFKNRAGARPWVEKR